MPASLSTMLKKLDLVSEVNRITLKDFYQYIQLKDLKSEHHITNLLNLLIFLDKFYGPNIPFTSINNKEQVLTFLNHRYSQKDGKWVEREHDLEVYLKFQSKKTVTQRIF